MLWPCKHLQPPQHTCSVLSQPKRSEEGDRERSCICYTRSRSSFTSSLVRIFPAHKLNTLQHSIAAHSLFLSLSSSFSKCQMVFIAAGGKIERRGLRSLKILSFPEGTQVCRAQRSLRAHLATVFSVSFKIKNFTEGRVKCSNNLRKNFTLFT